MNPNDPSSNPEQPEQQPVIFEQPSAAPVQPEPQVAQPMPESAQQPAFVPPQQQAQPAQPQQHKENPGKTLGIVGFILAFFFPLVGLPLSIIGLVKSKKAGMRNGLALAGVILNSIFIVAGLFLISITIMSYNGVQQRANSSNAKITAQNVANMAEMYGAENGEYKGDEFVSRYPKMFGDISSMLHDTTQAKTPMTSAPAQPNIVEFYACGDQTGNKVGYWDYTDNKVMYTYAGEATEGSTDCTLATQ